MVFRMYYNSFILSADTFSECIHWPPGNVKFGFIFLFVLNKYLKICLNNIY